MSYVLEGLMLGIGLALSLGPIFIALTETSIQKGTKAGLTVGLGIWISDILIVVLFFNFINRLKTTIESEGFMFWMGLSGAVILILFGIFLIIKRPEINYNQKKYTIKNYFGFFIKGFTVNTINPFTFIYWMGVLSTYIIGRNIDNKSTILLLGTILIIIVSSDIFKVLLARYLKNKLNSRVINYIFNFSGFILVIFGLYMFWRVY